MLEEVHRERLARSQVIPGDVLMNIVGPPLGKVAIVPDDYPEWNINQAITLFRPSKRISTKWLYYYLCSGINVNQIIHETRGSAGQQNISLSQCRNFVFAVPPVDEQEEIVYRIDILFDYVARIEELCQIAHTKVQNLIPSLLAKAFRGELVLQDPSDEPASILLERIKEVTTVQSEKPKRRATKKKPKVTNDSVKETIRKLEKDLFAFDDLQEAVGSDYDSLKVILFSLLDEKEPYITQIFDETAQAICFRRQP